jgi:hypothetical protein
MTMFAKMMSSTAATGASDAVIDNDPLKGVDKTDQFAQQREDRNANMSLVGDASLTDTTATQEVIGQAEDDVVVPPNDDDVVDDGDSDVVDGDDDDVNRMEQELLAIEQLGLDMDQLAGAAIAVESFGINPTAMGVMQAVGLLDSTALSSIALESVSFVDGEHAESQLALEALGEKIKEKAGAWSAKILNFTKDIGSKALDVITGLWDKVSGLATKLGAAAWDKTKAGAAVVKAHPYKTLAAVAAAIAVVGGIVVFVAGGAPAVGAKVDVVKNFLKTIVEHVKKINFPGAKITAALNEAGTKISVTATKAGGAVKAASLDALGWSQTAAKSIQSQLGRVIGQVKTGWAAVGAKATKLGTAVVSGSETVANGVLTTAVGASAMGDAVGKSAALKLGASARVAKFAGSVNGSMVGAGYFAYLGGLLVALYHLVKLVVVGGLRMVAATLRAITPHATPAAA